MALAAVATFAPLASLTVFYHRNEESVILSRLAELQIDSFESSPDESDLWVRLYHEDESALRAIEERLTEGLHSPRVVSSSVSSAWATNFLDFLEPVSISKQLMVVPHTLSDTPFSGIKIVIDPQMVFGSGGHATTVLSLRFLEEELLKAPHRSLLDVGFGTGVLSIAAAKLGAARTLGIEIDSTCLEIAKQNGELNHVTQCEFGLWNLSEVEERFDLCCVNIISSVVTALWSDILKRMNPGGRIIVSGYLVEEEFYRSLPGVRCLQTAEKEGWGACIVEVPHRVRPPLLPDKVTL